VHERDCCEKVENAHKTLRFALT